MEPEDTDVVARARGGDMEAFRALVERHSRPLFRLAWRITGSEQDAEDVVQETFMKAYRNLDVFESRANFGTWLHKIAANGAVTWEAGSNHTYTVPTSGTSFVTVNWQY